jgi:hypothetical protein
MVSTDQVSDADLAQGQQPEFRKHSLIGPALLGALPPKGKGAGIFALQVTQTGKDDDQLQKY